MLALAAPAAPAKQPPPVMFNCNACACGNGHHPVGSLIAPADTYIVPALVAAAVGAAVRSDCLVMAALCAWAGCRRFAVQLRCVVRDEQGTAYPAVVQLGGPTVFTEVEGDHGFPAQIFEWSRALGSMDRDRHTVVGRQHRGRVDVLGHTHRYAVGAVDSIG